MSNLKDEIISMIPPSQMGLRNRIRQAIEAHEEANKREHSIAETLRAALERISAGEVMSGEFTHAETVLSYQALARKAIAKALESA